MRRIVMLQNEKKKFSERVLLMRHGRKHPSLSITVKLASLRGTCQDLQVSGSDLFYMGIFRQNYQNELRGRNF